MCDGVFLGVDKNHDGDIDKDELVMAMCKIHYKLAKISPGVSEPPNMEEVEEKLKEFDIDASGGLSKQEFHKFCKDWFGKKGVFFLKSLVISSFMAMVVLPNSAGKMHAEVPGAKFLPKSVFKVVFGIAFKLLATRAPGLLAAAKNAAA